MSVVFVIFTPVPSTITSVNLVAFLEITCTIFVGLESTMAMKFVSLSLFTVIETYVPFLALTIISYILMVVVSFVLIFMIDDPSPREIIFEVSIYFFISEN